MIRTESRISNRAQRLLFAVCLPMVITACESNDSSLLDLDGIFGSDSATSTILTNDDSNEIAEEQAVVSTSFASNSGVPAELEILTRGRLRFESRFDGSTDPILDDFEFTEADYEFFPDQGLGTLATVVGTNVSICAYINETAQYLCFRSFDGGSAGRVWHLFTMQSATNGSGFFEFCNESVEDDECRDELFSAPDGSDTVTITPLNAAAASLPDASPYFAYGEQGTQSRQSISATIGEHHLNTINAFLAAASQSVQD